VLQGLDIELPGKNGMNFDSMVPRCTHKTVVGKSYAGKWGLVACNDLQQMPSLNIPGVDLVGVERTRKYHFTRVVKFETDQLATLVCPEHSELLLPEDIVGIDSAVEAA